MKHILIISILFITNNLFAQNNLFFSGQINMNTNWKFDTVFLTNNVTINDGTKLTISSGVKIIALGHYKIKVKGSIQAKGTSNNLIKFSILDTFGFTDTSTSIGGWNGIEFDSISTTNDSSIFSFCKFEYGKSTTVDTSKLKFQLPNAYCCGGGVIFIYKSSKIKIFNCDFSNNQSSDFGSCIYIFKGSSPYISSNIFKNNRSYFGGCITIVDDCAPIIRDNIFIKNKDLSTGLLFVSSLGSSISILSDENSTPLIVKNFFSNNESVNGTIYDSNNKSIIDGNIIVNNIGGGIYCGHTLCQSLYINNTICNNSYASGITLPHSKLFIINNIVRNNRGVSLPDDQNIEEYFGSMGSWNPSYYSNNVEFLQSALLNNKNIDKPTLFVRPTTAIGLGENGYDADWRLQKGSPEIDAGTLDYGVAGVLDSIDIYGTKRLLGSAIDIGAAEYNPITVIPEPYTSDKIKVYPNPFADHFWLQSEDVTLDADYAIYNIAGQVLFTYTIKGNDTKLIELHDLASGTYLLRITEKTGKILYASKVIKQ